MAVVLLVGLETTGLCAVLVPLLFQALSGQAPGAPQGEARTLAVAILHQPACPVHAPTPHHPPVPPPFVPRLGRWPSRDPSQHAQWLTGQGGDDL